MKNIVIKVGLACALLYLWLRFVDVQAVLQVLSNIDYAYILVPLIIMTLNLFLGSYISKLVLESKISVSFLYLVKLSLLGSVASLLAPANAGGFLRAYFIKNKYKKPFGQVFGLLLLEFVLDALVVFVVGGIAFLYFARYVAEWEWYVGGLITIVIVGYLVLLNPSSIKRFIKQILPSKTYDVLLIYFGALWRGFVSVSSTKSRLFKISGLLLVHHMLFGMSLYFVFVSLGIVRPVQDVVLSNSLLGVISSIPSLPGKIGHLELAGLVAFVVPLGITANQAGAAILLNRVLSITYIVVALLLVILLGRDDVRHLRSISLSTLIHEFKKKNTQK